MKILRWFANACRKRPAQRSALHGKIRFVPAFGRTCGPCSTRGRPAAGSAARGRAAGAARRGRGAGRGLFGRGAAQARRAAARPARRHLPPHRPPQKAVGQPQRAGRREGRQARVPPRESHKARSAAQGGQKAQAGRQKTQEAPRSGCAARVCRDLGVVCARGAEKIISSRTAERGELFSGRTSFFLCFSGRGSKSLLF